VTDGGMGADAFLPVVHYALTSLTLALPSHLLKKRLRLCQVDFVQHNVHQL
jgi:hypothetical protein